MNAMKFSIFVGMCIAVFGVAGGSSNATKTVEQEEKDNLAAPSDFAEHLYNLGSVSSELLSSGTSFEGGFTPISGPNSQVNEFSPHESEEHVKTITVTKNVPVPYPVTVEKRIPVRVEVPVDKPYPVYVPRPYEVVVEKKVPYEVKVPVPQPYTVEKRVPVPVKVHVVRPYPVHIPAPYPVLMVRKVPYTIEKHVPYPVKVPVVRPYPVHVPVEKQVPYPVEKTVPYPVHVTVERPVPVPVEKPYPVHVEKQVPVPVEKLIPVSVTIPVKVPVPIPVLSEHSHHAGRPTNNQYYYHQPAEGSQQQQHYISFENEQHRHNPDLQQQEHQNQVLQQQDHQYQGNHQQEYQFQGEETSNRGNLAAESGILHPQELPQGSYQQVEGQDAQQQQYHYERIPAYLQPQAYGTYELQQKSNVNPHELQVTTENTSNNHQSPLSHHKYTSRQQESVGNKHVLDKTHLFVPVEEYSKAIHDQYLKGKQEQAVETHGGHGEYDRLQANIESQDGKQESYFKVNLGTSVYTNSVHHNTKSTAGAK